MTINPRDYDLEELRRMARQDRPADPSAADRPAESAADDRPTDPAADDRSDQTSRAPPAGNGASDPLAGVDPAEASDRSDHYRELLPFLNETDEKPYLRRPPATYGAELLAFEWLAFLTERGGYHGAVDALEYYAALEWITDDVRSALSEYLRGIDGIERAEGDLDVDDHLRSLVYVAKLSAMD